MLFTCRAKSLSEAPALDLQEVDALMQVCSGQSLFLGWIYTEACVATTHQKNYECMTWMVKCNMGGSKVRTLTLKQARL